MAQGQYPLKPIFEITSIPLIAYIPTTLCLHYVFWCVFDIDYIGWLQVCMVTGEFNFQVIWYTDKKLFINKSINILWQILECNDWPIKKRKKIEQVCNLKLHQIKMKSLFISVLVNNLLFYVGTRTPEFYIWSSLTNNCT